MTEIYLISGLGADKRVFDYLDLREYRLNFIAWIDPLPRESIQQYAGRLSVQITTQRPTLIGVSFGGMIAIEIGKQMETEVIISISSAQTKNDLPSNWFTRHVRLHSLIPARFLKIPNEVLYWFFGIKSDSEKELLKKILHDTDEKFLQWALDKIITWENTVELENVVTIHGTDDHLIKFSQADYVIQDGGHLMIINRAAEVTANIRDILKSSDRLRSVPRLGDAGGC